MFSEWLTASCILTLEKEILNCILVASRRSISYFEAFTIFFCLFYCILYYENYEKLESKQRDYICNLIIYISFFLFSLLQAVQNGSVERRIQIPLIVDVQLFEEAATHRPLPYWLLISYQIHSPSDSWCILAELWKILISKPHPQNFKISISMDWVKAFMLAQNSIRFHFTTAWFRTTH